MLEHHRERITSPTTQKQAEDQVSLLDSGEKKTGRANLGSFVKRGGYIAQIPIKLHWSKLE